MQSALAIASVLGAFVTAIATIFLWRVTKILAIETQRMADAQSQPQIVATIEPNQWSMMHADLHIANTGNATAFDVEVMFDPPLVVDHEQKGETPEIPFEQISVLKPGQQLSSWVGRMYPLLDVAYRISISWRRSPSGIKDSYHYILNMADYKHVSRLGSGDPQVKLAEHLKKFQEEFHKVANGHRNLQADIFTSADRAEERSAREEFYRRKAERANKGGGAA